MIRARSGQGSGGQPGDGVDDDALEGCAERRAEAVLRPVHLFFLLDQSGSMGDGMHGSREQKWDPVTAALTAFFADPGVSNVHASLTLFPPNTNQGTGPADESLATGGSLACYVLTSGRGRQSLASPHRPASCRATAPSNQPQRECSLGRPGPPSLDSRRTLLIMSPRHLRT